MPKARNTWQYTVCNNEAAVLNAQSANTYSTQQYTACSTYIHSLNIRKYTAYSDSAQKICRGLKYTICKATVPME